MPPLPSITDSGAADAASQASLASLVSIIGAMTPGPGDFPTAIDGLGLFRRDEPSPPVTCILAPSIVLVVQGAKEMVIGGDVYPYDTTRFLITSLDLPANSAVTLASADVPVAGPCRPARRAASRARSHPRPVALAAAGNPLSAAQMRSSAAAAAHRLRRQPGSPDRPGHRLAEAQLHGGVARRGPGGTRADERAEFPPALSQPDVDEPAAISEMVAPERSPPVDAQRTSGRRQRRLQGRLRKPVAVQPRVRPAVRRATEKGHREAAQPGAGDVLT
nr:hypothetical protein [Tanacetum cinerariifolium]